MRKRTVVAAVCAAALVVLGVSAYIATRSNGSNQPAPQYWAKAKATKAAQKCLQANKNLTVAASERSKIEMSALSYLIDVPAGTNVDVRLATYNGTDATGSDYYPAKYGNYNFVMHRDSDGWRVSDFRHCN